MSTYESFLLVAIIIAIILVLCVINKIQESRHSLIADHLQYIPNRDDNIVPAPWLLGDFFIPMVPLKTPKDIKDPKKQKNTKGPKNTKDIKDTKDMKNTKNTKDPKDTKEYYDRLQNHDNDSQNVHNTAIVKSLEKKYKRLLELQPEITLEFEISESELHDQRKLQTFHEITVKSDQYHKDALQKRKTKLFLDEVRKGAIVTSISKTSISEDQILVLVWERIHQPINAENCEKMEIALLDQIVEGVRESSTFSFLFGRLKSRKSYHPVCIGGRVGHMLASLTLLDNDPVLSEPEKDEKEIANIAYLKANQIINSSLETWKTENIKSLYSQTEDTLSEEEKAIVDEFISHCKLEIEKEFRKEYTGLVSELQLKDIIQKAHQGV